MNRLQATRTALGLLMTLTVSAPADQQVVYPPSAMPRVDMHTHMDAKTQYAKAVEAMDQWGGTISITLAGLFWVKDNNGNKASPATVRQIPGNDMVYVKEKLNDRILFVPGAFTIPRDGIWWTVDEIKTFKEQGFVGLKLWPHGAILSSKIPGIHAQLDEAGRQGMPLVGYHTGDPGDAEGNSPAFPKFEDDTIDLVKAHPQTTFIFAHGLFMLQNDQGIKKLAGILDKYPNVFVDVAFTHNARQPANYTVSNAREFYIKYCDRILFGTDVFAAGAAASAFLNERRIFETNEVTNGLHGGPKLEGFKLPDPVLNHIYYWNAARLIPKVRQVLEARKFAIGYELGKFKSDRLPPDVSINKLTIVRGQAADLTGTLGSVTERLTVEIAGKAYPGIDSLNGTWKLPAARIVGLPAGTYDVKVTARNSIGLVRSDATTDELIVVAANGKLPKTGIGPEPTGTDKHDSPFGQDQPLLRGKVMSNEPVLFIQKEGQPVATGKLLFVPSARPTVKSPDLETVYEEGRDYLWKPGSSEIQLAAGSRIPFKTSAEMVPPPGSPNTLHGVLFSEGRFFHDLQVMASYPHADDWPLQDGPRPQGLPRSLAMLKAKQAFKLVALGDSITEGYNASGFKASEAPPRQPCYAQLVADTLHQRFGGSVALVNLGRAGTGADWGLKMVDKVAAEKPDLVILAFGMNHEEPAAAFEAAMRQLRDAVQTACPAAEIILVAPMTGNPRTFPAERFSGYRDALRNLTSEGIALADVTSPWLELLKRKLFSDLSGNNINHPNDFGHRLYAEVICRLLPAPVPILGNN